MMILSEVCIQFSLVLGVMRCHSLSAEGSRSRDGGDSEIVRDTQLGAGVY